jgi:hypothetical protein
MGKGVYSTVLLFNKKDKCVLQQRTYDFSILQLTQYTRQHLIPSSLVQVSGSLSMQTKQT